jgi:hypothetical protein
MEDLINKDQCIEDKKAERKGQVVNFVEEYVKSGSAWLLKDFKPEIQIPQTIEPDLSSLSAVSDTMRDRLSDLIDNQKKYFILIGNEREDLGGCCPSEEVTEANQLVKHGVLTSLAEPIKANTCPLTMYAFKDELSVNDKGFSSNMNEDFRREARTVLERSNPTIWQRIIKWILLIFIVASLLLAFRKCQDLQHGVAEGSLYEKLDISRSDKFVVVLFHNQKRCYQCLQMEKYTVDLINADFFDSEDEQVSFRTIIIDDPGNKFLVDQFGVFAATLVLLEYKEGELLASKVLLEATGLYRDEVDFKDHLKGQIQQFRIEND